MQMLTEDRRLAEIQEYLDAPYAVQQGGRTPAAAIFAAPAPAQQEVPPAALHQVGAQLVGSFTLSGPFNPTAPDHLWFNNGDGTYLFLHFDKPLSEATKLIYVGWAVAGRWCAEDQPKDFTHFHRSAKVAEWNAGHGGSRPREPGYWLKHVAVEEFDMKMMGMSYHVQPGTDLKFMPTNPPTCGR